MKALTERTKREERIDDLDVRILDALQDDARQSRDSIGRTVGLSAPAVHERIRKLERMGAIRGYAALLDAERVGCDLLAFVRVFIDHPRYEGGFVSAVTSMPEIQECHWVTGTASCLLKARTRDRQELQKLILDRINALEGVRQTETIVVLSTSKETPRIHLDAMEDRP